MGAAAAQAELDKCSQICPVYTTLDAIGGRWKPLIVWHLLPGPCRFNELRRLVEGVSQKVLTQQLRELERARLVCRRVYPEVPLRVEYKLTGMGRSLQGVLEAMADWGRHQEAMQLQHQRHEPDQLRQVG